MFITCFLSNKLYTILEKKIEMSKLGIEIFLCTLNISEKEFIIGQIFGKISILISLHLLLSDYLFKKYKNR